ncbi:hypothetical protein MOD48_15190 [Bacillus spizizenii]|uniref:Putative lipoprotein n=2 Tax=Bacillus spizizenii TaxID=96241 RepID=E0TY46_BACSH|nr:hypothetical protein [Bacillus spizizenii]MDU7574673.1 hypothetical protein [Bacillus subtilis]ADM38046.1 putative lipoprotein [Bacillus spizizenii str. W23]AJW87368.1 hypothetical protein BIS30_20565 [Bacillus spizizenii]EFG93188.1 putative lipoprotein [Bacillus spizizenii ATCC 6633 = JCM 2499]KFK79697.1 hypothetical protein DJ97_2705 [Bacillus spizizenii]
MKRVLFSLCVLIIGSIFVQSKALSLTFTVLPITQKTEQWSVKVSEAENVKELARPKKGKYHVYSLEVKNIGKETATVDVQLYRNDPDTITRFSLFGCPNENCVKQKEDAKTLAESLNDGSPLRFKHFMLADKASELEVVIIWTQKGQEGRHLKQTFKFTEDGVN